jgi:hypothetical protein
VQKRELNLNKHSNKAEIGWRKNVSNAFQQDLQGDYAGEQVFVTGQGRGSLQVLGIRLFHAIPTMLHSVPIPIRFLKGLLDWRELLSSWTRCRCHIQDDALALTSGRTRCFGWTWLIKLDEGCTSCSRVLDLIPGPGHFWARKVHKFFGVCKWLHSIADCNLPSDPQVLISTLHAAMVP